MGKEDFNDDFVENTGYGTGGGLCGWNCRHNFMPFDPEFMTNNLKKYNLEENEESYKSSQIQRKMEREIRKTKRKIVMLKTTISNTNNSDFKNNLIISLKKQEKLKNKQIGRYNSFCKEKGLIPLKQRLKISEKKR